MNSLQLNKLLVIFIILSSFSCASQKQAGHIVSSLDELPPVNLIFGDDKPEDSGGPGIHIKSDAEKLCDSFRQRAWNYYLSNNYDAAIAEYGHALQAYSNSADACYERALAYYKKKDYGNVIYHCRKAVEIIIDDDGDGIADFEFELSPYAYVYMGSSYYALRNFPLAIASFNKALEFNPAFDYGAYTHTYTAYAYFQFGDYENAKTYFESALEIDNSFPVAVSGLNHVNAILARSKHLIVPANIDGNAIEKNKL
jgi:tetratricopeptide (TPR) repeat protein